MNRTSEYDHISPIDQMDIVDEAMEPRIEHDEHVIQPDSKQTFQLGRNNSAIPKTRPERRLFLADFVGNSDINTSSLAKKSNIQAETN